MKLDFLLYLKILAMIFLFKTFKTGIGLKKYNLIFLLRMFLCFLIERWNKETMPSSGIIVACLR